MTRVLLTQTLTIIALASSILLANNLTDLFNTPWKLYLGITAVLIALSSAVVEITLTAKSQPKKFRGKKRDEKILKYMIKLLSTSDQYVISSNDLSWAEGKSLEVLSKKAQSNSLTLIMPKSTELSALLVAEGATAHYYGDENFKFASRFTLINPSRSGSWVAIGHGTEQIHTIRKISSKDDPAMHLVRDLYKLSARVSQNSNQS